MSPIPELPAGFLDLPHHLYADDPRWIPEEADEVRRLFSAANAWFDQGEAQAWAVAGAARVAAFRHPACRIDDRPAAFFGFWETVDDPRTSARLFALVEDWARRRGAVDLWGPVEFSTYGRYRLRLDGEGGLPFPGEPYNPPFYPRLLEAQGFRVARRYLTQIVSAEGARRALELFRPYHRAALEQGYRFGAATAEWWRSSLDELHPLVDRIFAPNPGYTPLSRTAFAAAMQRDFVRRACPEASVVAHAPDGALAGFLLAVPHYGPLTVAGAGESRVPVSALDYRRCAPLLDRRGAPDLLLKTVAVAPAHRHRQLMPAMAAEAHLRTGSRWDRWWNALMREDNPSRWPGEDVAAGTRWYGLYRKELPRRSSRTGR